MEQLYYPYSDYLKSKYHEKVYKLPVNLPLTCPNRLDGNYGCSFCSDKGTGFEAMSSLKSVTEQLTNTSEFISKRYHANKFIAYFQNFTNTFMPLDQFRSYLEEAILTKNLVEISISTRPDCIRHDYLKVLEEISKKSGLQINIELGLQTVNYKTLDEINRGHTLAEFIQAVLFIKEYHFTICTHMILNLPGDNIKDAIESSKILSALGIDIVKLHSLYIAKNSRLYDDYVSGKISLCSKEEYFERICAFLDYLDPNIAVERLFSRIPEEDSAFSNWGVSWWKLRDELLEKMNHEEHYQGKLFHYLNGAALSRL